MFKVRISACSASRDGKMGLGDALRREFSFVRGNLPDSRNQLDTDGYRPGDACSLLSAVC